VRGEAPVQLAVAVRGLLVQQEVRVVLRVAEQRRNKLLGEWAAGKLGLSGSAVDDYVKALRRADLATKGDEDVFQKLRKDFDDKGVAVSDADLRRAMSERLAQAVSQIEAERKG
jgi:hypothetical protein